MFRYFGNLEFLWDEYTLGPGLQNRRHLLTALSYVLLSLGLFSRQITAFPSVDLRLERFQWSVLAASLIIGLAVFPPVMRRLNHSRRKPSVEHAIAAFSLGFFIDLSSSKVLLPIWKTFSHALLR